MWWIIGGFLFVSGALFFWTQTKAGGDADDRTEIAVIRELEKRNSTITSGCPVIHEK